MFLFFREINLIFISNSRYFNRFFRREGRPKFSAGISRKTQPLVLVIPCGRVDRFYSEDRAVLPLEIFRVSNPTGDFLKQVHNQIDSVELLLSQDESPASFVLFAEMYYICIS